MLAEYLAGRPVATVREAKHAQSEWPTVAQLVAAYLLHAERYYRDADGTPTGEVVHARIALEPLVRLHRDTPTDQVHIVDLIAVRQHLIDQREQRPLGRKAPNGLSRRTINDRMARIKRLFRWGVEQGAVPGSTWHEQSALRGLPKGRCGVHDDAPGAVARLYFEWNPPAKKRCPALLALLLLCLGAGCSSFGTLAPPKHAYLDRLALDPVADLPTVRLIVGIPVTAVLHTGTGVLVGMRSQPAPCGPCRTGTPLRPRERPGAAEQPTGSANACPG